MSAPARWVVSCARTGAQHTEDERFFLRVVRRSLSSRGRTSRSVELLDRARFEKHTYPTVREAKAAAARVAREDALFAARCAAESVAAGGAR